MKKIKNTIITVKNKISLFLNIYRKLIILSPYLKNGFYTVAKDGKKYIIKKGAPVFFVFSFRKSSPCDNASLLITYWEKKYIFTVGDCCYSFYDKNSDWKTQFSNIEKYVEKINYPINKFNHLDYKHRLKIEPFVSSLPEQLYYSEYCHFFLEAGKRADKQILFSPASKDKKILYYVQHGDAHIRNIMTTDNGFVFIDLDDINNYPALFDYFRFIITDKQLLLDFINGKYDEKIAEVIGNNYADTSFANLKDLYFAAFIAVFPNSIGNLINCFPDNYKNTHNAFNQKIKGELP